MTRAALLLLLCAAPAWGQATDAPPAPAGVIHFPSLPTPPAPPAPSPSTAQPLLPGQWYLVDATLPLLVDQFTLNGGAVTITALKGPITLPASIAVGRAPDPNDPEVCTIPGPYVYRVTTKAKGTVMLDVLPTTNHLTAAGKPIPFTRADVFHRQIECLEVPPAPAPPTPPVPPPTPTDPLPVALQAAYKADGGNDAASLAFLTSAYKGMAASPKAGLATNLDALNWLKSVIEAPGVGLTATQIVNTRKAIATDLVAALGTAGGAPLDMAKFSVELGRIANALQGVK